MMAKKAKDYELKMIDDPRVYKVLITDPDGEVMLARMIPEDTINKVAFTQHHRKKAILALVSK